VPGHRGDDDPTIAPGAAAKTPSTSRFAPGAIIAGRYRLVALLGRGGMGEVYRADDLTLDQPVALKFLPEGVAADPSRLAQFHNELRVARQVSHKNVCRLYDLGEAEGRRFLTMEYVDGEDLASLLRRIGRLPQDKALETARQLCAGLAAAHERGVLHRDLKPANVMLDGDGNVRITDFGLAAVQGDPSAVHAGTPQYMAPEQLKGRPASVKSDIYALGLVLFEIFTGRRAYDARTVDQLIQLHESGELTTPSSVVRDLDPAVERVILRCLERDPGQRPATALAVAAALPGGDPLAAALAAGETPSPEMLAAAGEMDALPVAKGLGAVTLILAGLLLCAALAPRATVARLVPLDKPPAVLADRAEQILASLGYTEPRVDVAYGFVSPGDYETWIARTDDSPRRWEALSVGSPAALLFWHRTSPSTLVPEQNYLHVSFTDPPPSETDSHRLMLDTRGRLVEFHSVPEQFEQSTSPSPSPRWEPLFEASALSMAAFHPVTPQWTPIDFADARAAWEGPLPERPQLKIRVEAAAYRGRAVSFWILGPWSQPHRSRSDPKTGIDRIGDAVFAVLLYALLIGAILLARYHLRVGKGDVRGATRVAIFTFSAEALAWLLGNHHVADVTLELLSLERVMKDALLVSAALWVVYVALEPYGRRFWPDMLIGWSRLLSGWIRDPRVGRDVLIGASFGVVLALVTIARKLVPQTLGYAAPMPDLGSEMNPLLGSAETLVLWSVSMLIQLKAALLTVLLFVVLQLLTRRAWLAVALGMFVLFVDRSAFGGASVFWIELILELAAAALLTLVTIRFGLLAAAVALLVEALYRTVPFTFHVSHWSAAASNWTIAGVTTLALFGFYASRAGQPLFGDIVPRVASDDRARN
jgi:predicted Ser/Thr protein kinase